jgi:hypothetical protein
MDERDGRAAAVSSQNHGVVKPNRVRLRPRVRPAGSLTLRTGSPCSALSLSVAREEPSAQAAKAEIGCKADSPDHEDTGEDALCSKPPAEPPNHVSHTNSCPDHLGGNDHDERNTPGQAHSCKNIGQAGGQDYDHDLWDRRIE